MNILTTPIKELKWEAIKSLLLNSWRTRLFLLISFLIFTLELNGLSFVSGGIGIEKSNSVTTKTVETSEKDKQGKAIKIVTTTKYDDGKTLWDWLSLLGVPLSLAILGYVLQIQQQKRAEKLSEEQRRLAENETKEEVLQTYFDRLSVLLIDKNLIALSNKLDSGGIFPEEKELLESSLDVIRARTLSILRRFEKDVERKTSVIRFLIEADIVGKLKLDLSEANLSGTDLSGTDLSGANLSGTDLSWVELEGTDLSEANLSGTELKHTNFIRANLSEADLSEANLSGASLLGASLFSTELINIKWDSMTAWPDKSNFFNAKNIPEQLKKELGITP